MGQNQWYHFGVGALPNFSGDWTHWGYDLDFDPWPNPVPIALGLSLRHWCSPSELEDAI